MRINDSVLVKRIKEAGKSSRLLWQYVDGFHYVTNAHWMVKLSNLDSKVMATLVGFFGKIPNDGEVFQYQRHEGVSKSSQDMRKLADTSTCNTSGRVTRFLHEDGKVTARIFAFPDFFAFVNNDYVDIVEDARGWEVLTQGKLSPIIFTANKESMFLVLPYNVPAHVESSYWDELNMTNPTLVDKYGVIRN